MRVPYVDLSADQEEQTLCMRAINNVISKGRYSSGEQVEAFEEEFAKYCEARFCVAVGSGTDALWLALSALEIGPGDEVITVANTYIATAEAIARTGAKPIFVDIDPLSLTLDADLLQGALTKRTKAIIPVHLYGHPAGMDAITAFAEKYDLFVVEDAAQAHGARYNGRKVGGLGDLAAFSFYPTKNLGAYGEAGAVTTSNHKIACRLRALRNHGQLEKNRHDILGWNCRMDEIQAAVLREKLRFLDENNAKRRKIAQRYLEALASCKDLMLNLTDSACEHVFHVFAIGSTNRDELRSELLKAGVETSIHYPTPIYRQPAFKEAECRSSMFYTEEQAKLVISLPIYPSLPESASAYVSECALQFWARTNQSTVALNN